MRNILFFLFTLVCCMAQAQEYTSENSLFRKAISLYQQDRYGEYSHRENVYVDTVKNVMSIYAYDKQSQDLYVRTSNGNYVIMLNYDYAKSIENNSDIPTYDAEAINAIVAKVNAQLDAKYRALNDSITKAEEAQGTIRCSFYGGEEALLSFVSQHLVYPPKAVKNSIQGIVVVIFQVKEDGKVGKIKVEKSLTPECDKAAVKVVKALPRFSPAKSKGKPVTIWFRLPIRFRISD